MLRKILPNPDCHKRQSGFCNAGCTPDCAGRAKKEPLESGSVKFGRGCLKGSFRMRQGVVLRKCETGNYKCEKRNRSIELLDTAFTAFCERNKLCFISIVSHVCVICADRLGRASCAIAWFGNPFPDSGWLRCVMAFAARAGRRRGESRSQRRLPRIASGCS